jgi:hypothetical protein
MSRWCRSTAGTCLPLARASADALRRRVAGAARGSGSFTIGFMPGLIVTAAVRAMLGLHPQLTVNVLRTS